MRSKWLASLAGLSLLALAGGLWHFMQRARQPAAPSSTPGSEAGNSAVPSSTVAAFRAAAPMKRVQEFYAEESRRVGQVDANPALTQRRLSQVAHELNTEEIRWLGGQALDPGTEGDARFFAAYLLALSDQPQALGTLSGIALSPIPASKNERRMAEERMIRAQAEEGIARHCQAEGARGALLDVVEKQADEFLRDRAHRALYFCATGKSLEEQDREALGKLRGGR